MLSIYVPPSVELQGLTTPDLKPRIHEPSVFKLD